MEAIKKIIIGDDEWEITQVMKLEADSDGTLWSVEFEGSEDKLNIIQISKDEFLFPEEWIGSILCLEDTVEYEWYLGSRNGNILKA